MNRKEIKNRRHIKHLQGKIKRYQTLQLSTEGLKRELAYSTGAKLRPTFLTGRKAREFHELKARMEEAERRKNRKPGKRRDHKLVSTRNPAL